MKPEVLVTLYDFKNEEFTVNIKETSSHNKTNITPECCSIKIHLRFQKKLSLKKEGRTMVNENEK